MKIIQPHKISTEIIDIIYEAKERLVIVSPYVNLSNWERMATELKNAKKRGIQIDFYVRNEPENSKSWEQVKELGIKPTLVSNLHAKFYFNEKNGIISSMNLLGSSNSNSIEIGCKLEKAEEIEELNRFLKDFIITSESKSIPNEEDLYLSKERFFVALENYLSNFLQSRSSVYFKNGQILINTLSNKFELGIDKVNNTIGIHIILSGVEADKFKNEHKKYLTSKYFKYELNRGQDKCYDTILAYSEKRLSNAFLDNLRVNEKKELISEIAVLLKGISEFKKACR